MTTRHIRRSTIYVRRESPKRRRHRSIHRQIRRRVQPGMIHPFPIVIAGYDLCLCRRIERPLRHLSAPGSARPGKRKQMHSDFTVSRYRAAACLASTSATPRTLASATAVTTQMGSCLDSTASKSDVAITSVLTRANSPLPFSRRRVYPLEIESCGLTDSETNGCGEANCVTQCIHHLTYEGARSSGNPDGRRRRRPRP
jgi:hypothetical protein